jgi:ATP-dependent helicase/nuclease subunit B
MILTKEKVKSIDIDFELNHFISGGEFDKFLMIVPTNRKARSLKRELISASPKGIATQINLETLSTFSEKIFFEGKFQRINILSEPAAAVLLKQTIQLSEMNYFSGYKTEIPDGTLKLLLNVISEYKRHGITPADLKATADQLDISEKLKAFDIARIYVSYSLKCNQLGVNEIGDIYSALIKIEKEEFEKRFRKNYPEAELLLINGFDEFTKPEIELINNVTFIAGIKVYLLLDYFKFNPKIFSHLDAYYKSLEEKGFKEIDDLSPSSFSEFSAAVREFLFLKKPAAKINLANPALIKIIAPTREKEIEQIAKEIKQIIFTKKIRPNRICVAFNLLADYSSIVRDIFSVYGIPFNLTDRYDLSTSQPVISIINLLEISENDFFYKNLFRALSSVFLRDMDIDLSNLIQVSAKLKVISGFQNWKDAIENLLITQADVPDEINHYSLKKEKLKKALSDLEGLYKLLKRFEGKFTPDEFHKVLTGFINELKLPEKIINQKNSTVEINIKAFAAFFETLDEIFYLLKLEFNDNEKFNLIFYLNHIRTAISSTRFNIKEKPGYGVLVTSINEIRGLKFDYLFVASMCDGDFPTRYKLEIFFSGAYKKNDLKHELEERYHFYQTICCANKALYITIPLKDDHRELVPSNYLKTLSDIFQLKEKTESDFNDKIYSNEELHNLIGEFGFEARSDLFREKISDEEFRKISHIVQTEKKRIENPFEESPFLGNISEALNSGNRDLFDDLAGRKYSVTQLETYALCPYKFFAERILYLEIMEEPTEEIETVELGSLLHKILYRFYTSIHEKNIILRNCSKEQFDKATKILFDIAKKEAEKINLGSPLTFYEYEKLFGIGGKKENSILYKFLEFERTSTDEFVPALFEKEFSELQIIIDGITGTSNQKSEINLTGKIDRIDVDEKNNVYKVIDYKSGKASISSAEIREGLKLQLPLYLFAAQKLIKAQLAKDMQPFSAELYSLKFMREAFGPKQLKIGSSKQNLSEEKQLEFNKSQSQQMIEICLNAIRHYVKSIYEGKFHLSKLEDRESRVCRYCGFRSICRIQQAVG